MMTWDEYDEYKGLLAKLVDKTLPKELEPRLFELNSKLENDRYEDNKANGWSNE